MGGYDSPLVSRASTTKRHRTRQSSVHSLSLSTGFERMSTSLVSPTALRWFRETIHCLKVETAHFVFFSVFLGTNPFEIVSNCSEDTISVKHCFPFKEAGTYMLLWWLKVVILFLAVGINPVTHPELNFIRNLLQCC